MATYAQVQAINAALKEARQQLAALQSQYRLHTDDEAIKAHIRVLEMAKAKKLAAMEAQAFA